MGRKMIGVVYGCRVPDGLALYDDESDEGGLIEQFDSAEYDRTGELRPSGDPEAIRTDERFAVLGAWVFPFLVRGGSLDPLDLHANPVARFADTDEGRQAVAAWERFAEWAKARGHDFGEPRFWLAEREIA